MMEKLLEALKFCRGRIEIAVLEIEAGDPLAAAKSLASAADKLAEAITEAQVAA